MTTTRNLLVLLAFALAGCGGGGSGGGAGRVAPALTPAISARVPDAPDGTVVHLLAPGVVAPDAGLLAHAGAITDTLDVGSEGEVVLPQDAAAPKDVLVSAPGRALLRVSFSALTRGDVVLVPEAVISARVVDSNGAPEADAVAIVLDRDGRPVPVPAEWLASGVDGELRATRLPGGDYTLVIGSADGARHAVLRVSIPAGTLASHTLTLAEDQDAARRFLEVVAGAGAAAAADVDASLESAR